MNTVLTAQLDLLLDQYGVEALEAAVDRGEVHIIHTNASQSYPSRTFTLTNGEYDRIMVEVNNGMKIAAIKLFREITGCGLVDAKNAIEGPDINMLSYDQRYGTRNRCG